MTAQENKYDEARREMVRKQLRTRGINDPRVLAAFLNVPRHLFVERAFWSKAYDDHQLSIGENQTISQPYTVAMMTESVKLNGKEKVLEIGTGCGYQTAILLEIVKQVYSVERIKKFVVKARVNLEKLGYTGFDIKNGDGTLGWPDHEPYDAIIVAAGSPEVPQSLMDQLAVGGRLVIPLGDKNVQTMTRITRRNKIEYKQEELGEYRFVELIGKEGWKK